MKIVNLFLTLFLGVILFSCGSSGEDFYLEKDGSGRLVSKTDLSSMWGLMQMGLQQQTADLDKMDPTQREFIDLLMASEFDTTFTVLDFASNIAEAQGGGPVGVADLMQEFENNDELSEAEKDEIRPLMAMLANTEMRLMGNEGSGQYGLNSTHHFDKPSELLSIMDGMTQLIALSSDETNAQAEQGWDMLNAMGGEATRYELRGNTLHVSRPAAEKAEMEDPQMAMVMSILDSSQDFVIDLHLPGKIKKVSRDAEIDKNAGHVVVTIPAAELDNGFDFTIKFKPRR